MFLHLRGGKPLTRISRANWKKNLSNHNDSRKRAAIEAITEKKSEKNSVFDDIRTHASQVLVCTATIDGERSHSWRKWRSLEGSSFTKKKLIILFCLFQCLFLNETKLIIIRMSKKIFIIENYDEEKITEKVNFNLKDILFRGNPTGFFFSTKLANILEVFCTITLIDNLDIFIWHISRWTHNKFEIIILQPNQVSKLPLLA